MSVELPPFDIEFFNKWKQSNSIVKECDMDDAMIVDVKDHIITGIEKMTTSDGVDFAAACKFIKENMDR